ncbi:MAG: 16S rRNA (uracil(1498)-N(3))-methyltransferase [Armatimonadetes bacterium]|nr:16S rRNA (uracil(1498)-N(3))-methyltransferase [Armatimonadota bacterium]
MRLPRVYVEPSAVPGLELTLAPEEHHHLRRVLRLRPGDRFLAFDGTGREMVAELGDRRRARVLETSHPEVEPRLHLTLFLALCKTDRFDRALEKAAELGVRRVVPLGTSRCTVHDPGRARQERWSRLVRGAAALAGRVLVPEIAPPVDLAGVAEEALGCDRALILLPGGPPLRGPLGGRAALLIGPEGGFSPEEEELAKSRGLEPAGLGPRVLRVETAAVAAISLAFYLAGDMEEATG